MLTFFAEQKGCNKGITLVEVLVASVLLGVVALVGYNARDMIQNALFKTTSRDAHSQYISAIKNRTGKKLRQIFLAANSEPAKISGLLNDDIQIGDGIRVRWSRPAMKGGDINIDFGSNASKLASESIRRCRRSRSSPESWQGQRLENRLNAKRLLFCGELVIPQASAQDSQSLRQADYGFLLLDVNYKRALDGENIPLKGFGSEGTLAVATWTLFWNYERGKKTFHQYRKGTFYIVPVDTGP
ncbi:prepilin-type N-terminal cleavage/methylation domain-containing protein [Pseudobacteriovorax antillogorgiicola]|uniref:Prepilin-type N-terminal cleavage/methylation domain-containing protein n=1 Tax=Pseudobacteriovorax antillogorgiicola TaxID=1513793 RepID=A0A1Y6CDR4_9BACT|nr:prepilin-type N-terminal cleavage/methylation domain-containing protein [Pseudobacteriovorax antillogorgiicola]TCS47937.1 prepilin-type N-terminal cleavage/methylation domain-containing protein [Pseudobacteriovorax antillogorgiicola]SMF58042.1 prepilin-type N-terminal cleavage/methylation domain-containing protein [Pseudobacteriovorax antillogorgiicola]